jgi:hypothetical protein
VLQLPESLLRTPPRTLALGAGTAAAARMKHLHILVIRVLFTACSPQELQSILQKVFAQQ